MNTPRAHASRLILARLAVACAAALLAACGGSDPGYCMLIGADLATGQPAQVIEVDPSTFVGPLLPCDDPRLHAR